MKKFFLSISLSLFLILNFNLVTVSAVAESYGLEETALTAFGNTTIKEQSDKTSVPKVIGHIIDVILSLLGIIFLIIIIYGGLMWMTAGGNDEKVGKAIKIFTAASFGLLIVIAAFLITSYIGNAFINSLK